MLQPPRASQMQKELITYLRGALPQMRAQGGGTLGRQATLSRDYLAIMQARMKERLEVSFDIPDYLEHAPIPPMMLMILIENSIKHGLEPKIAGGRIDVSAELIDGDMHVKVRDNGIGFNLHSDEGVGLSNVRERLRMLYGDRAELVIEAPLDGGAQVTIRLPYENMEFQK